jgi:acylphosphatase
MMVNKAGIHCFVTGKVQGVWFRAATKAQAELLDLTGWVRNLPDGSVEVMAYGDKEKLAQLYQWLKSGPPLASVRGTTYEEIEWQVNPAFKVI